MRVSVVIPVYNEEQFLLQCLTALANQTEKPDEIIIVDNNSTDKTAEVAKRFNVKVVNEEKQGITPARNRGFDEAKYEIIARTDADSKPPQNWIANIKKQFIEKNIDGLSGPVIYYDLPMKNKNYTDLFFRFMHMILHHDLLLGPNFAIKNDTWKKVKKYICLKDGAVHEDFDLSFHLHDDVHGKILFDHNHVMMVSGRRISKNPTSFFGEYFFRLLHMLWTHKIQKTKNLNE